ncbi:hypothetical protein DL96DRAFT_1608518 [Flagelloscypha sp. PMI_526]|nr:hypothetical protein DL96DRAFT_1608518 [Flagelloscypha sp. PMI_526]
MATHILPGSKATGTTITPTQQQGKSILNANVALSRPFPVDMLEDLRLRAPIYRLPADILLEIFTFHCFSWNILYETYDNIWSGPLSLGQVCHFWRSVAESSPSLWAIIPFSLKERNPKFTLARSPSILNKWLALSRDTLLSVFISGDASLGSYDDLSAEERICQAIASLMALSHRWRTLKLVMKGTCPYWISTSTQLPNLQEFSLHFLGDEERHLQGYLSVISNAPSIRKFDLFGMALRNMAGHRMMLRPFLAASTQISEITAIDLMLSIQEVNSLLALQPGLKTLCLQSIMFGTTMPTNVVSHPLLSKFGLSRLDESNSINSRFDGLILPNLTRFHLLHAPVVEGSALIHHLFTTAKDRLYHITCGGWLEDNFVFLHKIQSLRLSSLRILAWCHCNVRATELHTCGVSGWIDRRLRFLEQPSLQSAVVTLSFSSFKLTYAKWAIKKMLCNTLEKYAEKRLEDMSLNLEFTLSHYPLKSIPHDNLKKFVECLGEEIEDETGKQIRQFWHSTTCSNWGVMVGETIVLHLSRHSTSV